MPTNLHMVTWKRIIDALIPTTTITSQWNSYDEQVNHTLSKTSYFSVRNHHHIQLKRPLSPTLP